MIHFSLAHYERASAGERAKIETAIQEGFKAGEGLYIIDHECEGVSREQISRNVALVHDALRRVEIDEGFVGIDGKTVKRRSFCLINEFARPGIDFSYVSGQVGACDGLASQFGRRAASI